MAKDYFVIVESPSKANTISKFLPNAFVMASKGHITELPKHRVGVKIENGTYTPEYSIEPGHKDVVAMIKKHAKDKHVYLATDDDREGEAISYFITLQLGGDPLSYDRTVFHEITKDAILKALQNPRKLNMDLVHAQQARQMLDKIVGYKISPLLCNKIESHLSAGRVQSPVLKLVLERDREIAKFQPVTYYELPVIFKTDLESSLVSHKGEKIAKMSILDKAKAEEIKQSILNDSFTVGDITSKKQTSKPQPPFKTTTLQQVANNVLGYSPTKTMQLAQKLYEGVEMPGETKGAITYMRTDSLNLAEEAVSAIRNKIYTTYGKEYITEQPRKYVTNAKGAQEAHEAIRVTDVNYTPEIAKKYLESDMLKLYTLIYNRTLMCQMSDGSFEQQTLFINGKDNVCKLSGRKVLFDGWTKLKENTKGDVILPNLTKGSKIDVQEVKVLEKQTEPPARYNAASLVKTMEELGIGRPSTYATIVNTLIKREYVKLDGKAMIVTPRGEKVVDFLDKYFAGIMNYEFTSDMEKRLDDIAEGKDTTDNVLNFYLIPMLADIKKGYETIEGIKPAAIPTGEKCPKCDHELVKRKGKYGDFIGCSNYPKCKYIVPNENIVKKELELTDMNCPICKSSLAKVKGRFGDYFKCSKEGCKFLTSFPIAKETCPNCNGWMQARPGKNGTILRCLKCNPPQPKFGKKG